MSSDPNPVLTRKFMELRKEVEGVEKTFVYPHIEEGHSLQRDLEAFTNTLPGLEPLKLSVETGNEIVAISVAEHFLAGAVLRRGANITLIEIILERMTSNLEKYLKNFRETPTKTVEKHIRSRIDGLFPFVKSRMALTLSEWEAGGEIKVMATPGVEEKRLREQIEIILSEEIPFFYRNDIAVDVNHISVFTNIRKEKLRKVIEKVQVM